VILAGPGGPWADKLSKELTPANDPSNGEYRGIKSTTVPTICQLTFIFLPLAFTDDMGAEKTISTEIHNEIIITFFHIIILLSIWVVILNSNKRGYLKMIF